MTIETQYNLGDRVIVTPNGRKTPVSGTVSAIRINRSSWHNSEAYNVTWEKKNGQKESADFYPEQMCKEVEI